jgi:hypothetical protein
VNRNRSVAEVAFGVKLRSGDALGESPFDTRITEIDRLLANIAQMRRELRPN